MASAAGCSWEMQLLQNLTLLLLCGCCQASITCGHLAQAAGGGDSQELWHRVS